MVPIFNFTSEFEGFLLHASVSIGPLSMLRGGTVTVFESEGPGYCGAAEDAGGHEGGKRSGSAGRVLLGCNYPN